MYSAKLKWKYIREKYSAIEKNCTLLIFLKDKLYISEEKFERKKLSCLYFVISKSSYSVEI